MLGTAHPPGYPTFAMLSWPVAQIPFGTLAFRINSDRVGRNVAVERIDVEAVR